MKRVVIIYKDNYVGALALFTRLRREMAETADIVRNSISVNSYAYFNDNSKLYMFYFNDMMNKGWKQNSDITYVDKELAHFVYGGLELGDTIVWF